MDGSDHHCALAEHIFDDRSKIQYKFGPVAHLVERLTCTEEVAGSSPVRSTNAGEKLKVKSL